MLTLALEKPMHASIPTSLRLSFRQTFARAAAVALVALPVACDKKADEAPATGASSIPAAAVPAPAAAAKKPATTLTLADLKKAYKSEFDDMSKAALPMDKKVEAFVAKVGKPESDTGRTKTWYALDSGKCSKVVIDGKDGSIMDETAANADCGL
jgi:hypothetical protein